MWYKYVLLMCVLVHVCACERLLVMFPVSQRSHTLLGDHLVKTLIDGGHDVTYVTTFTRVRSSGRLRVIDISSADDEDGSDNDSSYLPEPVSSRLPQHHMLTEGARLAARALRHPNAQALIQDTNEHFDLVVAEWYYSGLLAPLASVFECPLVWYSAEDASWLSLRLVHEASGAASYVDPLARGLPRLPPNGWDRAYRITRQAYLTAWVTYMTNHVESPAYYEIYQLAIQRRGRTPPLYENLVYNGSMLLVNSHPLLGQGLPLPSNAKYVAGHHIQGAAVALPKKLQTVLDSAKHGVIYFNLGPSVSEELSPGVKEQLLRAFRQVEQTVVWRHRGRLEHVPGNVLLEERVPLQAVLRHPNTVLMITYGGWLPYLEAMYFGVPVIGVPLQDGQHLTVDVAAAGGRGLKVPFSGTLGHHIKEAVLEILGNFTYRRNAKQASAILQQPLVPVHQELLYWLELVMSTGGAPHLRSRDLHLSLMERFHLDVIAAVIMVCWFLSKVKKLVQVYWNDLGVDSEDLSKKNE